MTITFPIFAITRRIGDLSYNLDWETLTAEVTYSSSSGWINGYQYENVIIPSSVVYNDKTFDVIGIGSQAFENSIKLETIAIPPSITYISSLAFSGCPNLKIVEICDLTAWCRIDFYGIIERPWRLYLNGQEITNLILPDSIEEIKPKVFAYCASLESVSIPNAVTAIGEKTFSNCTSLTSVSIGSSLISIGKESFRDCPIETLTLNCNKILSWFRGFESIKNVTIGNDVSIIGNEAFFNCTGISSIVISNSVTEIGLFAFYNCTNLERVGISDLEAWCNIDFADSSSNPLTYAKHLFLNSTEITDLTLPNSIKEIKPYTFNGCI